MPNESLYGYRGNLPWLHKRTIYLTVAGSHAYGTNIETSDLDIRGIAVPPKNYLLGCVNTFEQTQWVDQARNAEATIFGLHKFIKLAIDSNPNIIELLYTDERDLLLCTDAGRKLRDARDLFLSKKAKYTFSGYAISQLKRIRSHRKFLLDPPKAPPTRKEFGLPESTPIPKDHREAAEAAIQKKLDEWEPNLDGLTPSARQQIIDSFSATLEEMQIGREQRFLAAGRTLGLGDDLMGVLANERRFADAQRRWQQYQTWLTERNEARAELERKFGYDTKHAMHLCRLMTQCVEILTHHTLTVRRPDAAWLLDIRNGTWSYEELEAWAIKMDAELNAVYVASTLQRSADIKAIDDLVVSIVEVELA